MPRAYQPAFILPAVLFILIMLGVLIATFSFRVHANVSSAQAEVDRLQTRLAAEAGVETVKLMLRTARLDVNRWYNNPDELNRIVVWSPEVEPTEWGTNAKLEERAVAYRFSIVADDPTDDEEYMRYGITDEAASLNLNTATAEQLLALVTAAVADDPLIDPQQIVNAILDWRDADDEPRDAEYATERDYYEGLDRPYKIKNGPFESVEELLLVRGVTGEVLYGEDFDRNGLRTQNEEDGDETFPFDNQDEVLNKGLYPYLTVLSYESDVANNNRQRVYLYGGESTLRTELAEAFPDEPEVVDFIVAVTRQPQGGDQTGGGGGEGGAAGGGGVRGGGRGTGGRGAGERGGAGDASGWTRGAGAPGTGAPERRGGEASGGRRGEGQGREGASGTGQRRGQGDAGAQPGATDPRDRGVPSAEEALEAFEELRRQEGGDKDDRRRQVRPGSAGGDAGDVPPDALPEDETGSEADGAAAAAGEDRGGDEQLDEEEEGEPTGEEEGGGTGGMEGGGSQAQSLTTPAGLLTLTATDGGVNPLTVEHLPVLLDRLTVHPATEQKINGLVNVNTAPPQVLRLLPGLTAEQVSAIVETRGGLTSEAKATTAWLVQEEILDLETYIQVAPLITARGQQFSIESVGFADHLGMITRIRMVLDMTGPIPQTILYRDESQLGGRFLIREKDEDKIRVR